MSMANTPAQVALDEKGLEKAADAVGEVFGGDETFREQFVDAAESAIRAYLSSLSDKAGDDGQGALVERLDLRNGSKNMAAFPDGRYVRYSDYAALRADKERLERERDRYRNGLQVLATTFYKGDEHQDYAKHVLGNDAAESRLQGQAQGKAVAWETFCDAAYYDMWAVRRVGGTIFNDAFHVPSREEAEALTAVLNAPAQPAAQVVVKARKGQDWLEDGADHTTYGIDIACDETLSSSGWWGNKIHVYGDPELREHILSALASPTDADAAVGWRDDPSSDERWCAGLDYGQTQLCNLLGVDPATIDWDAATETLDGDVQAVIGKILTARFGEDWPSALTAAKAGEDGR